ncbi:MAG: hypothetical protein CML06_00760 [Pseudomonadales bacterium]|nr:hypothetical protein [Pseudomonadales bacterium]
MRIIKLVRDSASEQNQELTLRDIFSLIWKHRFIVLLFSIISMLIAIFIAFRIPEKYESTAIVMPVQEEQQLSSQLLSQVGGLAGLAGLAQQNRSNKINIALEIITSRKFLAEFARKHDIEQEVVAGEDWDEEKAEWIIDTDTLNNSTSRWNGGINQEQHAFSDWVLHKSLIDKLIIVENEETGSFKIGFELFSPIDAKNWTTWLIDDLNNEVRQRDINQATTNINYLKEQIQKTAISEMKPIFYQIIAEQSKTMMLAEARKDYIFSIVDPMVVPEKKSKPKRFLIIVVGVGLGFFISSIYVLARRGASN